MSSLSKRSTIYFDPAIHQALKLKSATTHQSISEIMDEAARLLVAEDQQDLESVADRVAEPEVSYEQLINDLKAHGKI